MELIDVMVFIPSFSTEKLVYFKEEFLQGYISSEEFYESPKYSLPVLFETKNFLEMWNYVIDEQGRSFTFYFENTHKIFCPKAAIQVNIDGSICLVLSFVDLDHVEEYESKLKNSFPDDNCFTSYSYFMPFSREDFYKTL